MGYLLIYIYLFIYLFYKIWWEISPEIHWFHLVKFVSLNQMQNSLDLVKILLKRQRWLYMSWARLLFFQSNRPGLAWHVIAFSPWSMTVPMSRHISLSLTRLTFARYNLRNFCHHFGWEVILKALWRKNILDTHFSTLF